MSGLSAFKRLLALCGFPQRGAVLPRVIAQSAVAASVTGTVTETTLATIAIPAGAMGPHGVLRVTTLWSHTNSANSKTLRVKLSATAFLGVTTTTSATNQQVTMIRNRGAANSQVGYVPSANGPFGSAASALVSGAVDTDAQQALTITATLANTSETITLEAFTVEILTP